MRGVDLQGIADVKRSLQKSIARLEVVNGREVLGEKTELGVRDPSISVVLKRELELGEIAEELAGDLVEEQGALAVELRRHPHGRAADGELAFASSACGVLVARKAGLRRGRGRERKRKRRRFGGGIWKNRIGHGGMHET